MSKRKPLDKTQIRERRDRMLEAAAAADLSLTEGVREMRAIAGMTQEEFARHRGVSARVIKALELGQGNPTVATLNRIGEFFGLEVAFVPIRRTLEAALPPQPGTVVTDVPATISTTHGEEEGIVVLPQPSAELLNSIEKSIREAIQRAMFGGLKIPKSRPKSTKPLRGGLAKLNKSVDASTPEQPAAKRSAPARKKKNSDSP